MFWSVLPYDFYKIVYFSANICCSSDQHILQTCKPSECNEKIDKIFLSPFLILKTRPLLDLLQPGFPSIKGNLSFWAVKFYAVWTCLYTSMSIRKRHNYEDRIYLVPTQILEVWTHLYVSEFKPEGNCNSSGYYSKVNLNMYEELDSLLNIQGLYLKK